MFRRKNKDLDIEGLNEIISIGKKILKIGFIMIIIALTLIGTYLIKEWHILSFLKDFLIVISPVFIGLIIAWLFDPLVTFLHSKKLPRLVACILVYVVFLGGIYLICSWMMPLFIDQIKDFIGTIPDILKDLKHFANNLFNNMNHTFDYDFTPYKIQIYETIENIGLNLTTNLPNMLIDIFKSLLSGGMTFVLGLMIGFYMLFDFDKVNKNLLSIMPRSWRKNTIELTVRLNESLRGYVQGVFLVMLLVFITQSIGLSIAGIKAPLVFALFCAITDIIPYFGPYIGAIPAVIVGFTMSPIVGICCIISIVIVQLLENNFYQPLIMGHTMKLHPVTIILGLLIFQHFFGIIGMIVATPVIACCKVILSFIDEKMNVIKKVTGDEIQSI